MLPALSQHAVGCQAARRTTAGLLQGSYSAASARRESYPLDCFLATTFKWLLQMHNHVIVLFAAAAPEHARCAYAAWTGAS